MNDNYVAQGVTEPGRIPFRVRGYLAVCGTCGGAWGATVADGKDLLHVAAFAAETIADGGVVLGMEDMEDVRAGLQTDCVCAHKPHSHEAPVDGPPACPSCGLPAAWLEPRNTCRACGTRYTLRKALTMYTVTKHRPASPDHAVQETPR